MVKRLKISRETSKDYYLIGLLLQSLKNQDDDEEGFKRWNSLSIREYRVLLTIIIRHVPFLIPVDRFTINISDNPADPVPHLGTLCKIFYACVIDYFPQYVFQIKSNETGFILIVGDLLRKCTL